MPSYILKSAKNLTFFSGHSFGTSSQKEVHHARDICNYKAHPSGGLDGDRDTSWIWQNSIQKDTEKNCGLKYFKTAGAVIVINSNRESARKR